MCLWNSFTAVWVTAHLPITVLSWMTYIVKILHLTVNATDTVEKLCKLQSLNCGQINQSHFFSWAPNIMLVSTIISTTSPNFYKHYVGDIGHMAFNEPLLWTVWSVVLFQEAPNCLVTHVVGVLEKGLLNVYVSPWLYMVSVAVQTKQLYACVPLWSTAHCWWAFDLEIEIQRTKGWYWWITLYDWER